MRTQPSKTQIAFLKAALFVAALGPLAKLVAGVLYFPESLGANPAEFITRSTGDWTLRFLLITLAVTPVRRLTGWNWLLRLRRMLGLYAFFYGVMHASSYAGFDQIFDFSEILADIAKRPFITVGFAALLLMGPLAATSTNAMVRRLGAARWQALHRLIYLIAPLGVLHFWWMVKRDIKEPAIYATVLAVLLAYRAAERMRTALRPARLGVKP
ncbi:MAG TPA: protein-methionine-sulfoxide reductase heme-binding subunit MsrQ [Burkholderiales bacterium]|nr:protein-methionine-sulfoxide reductase heme-binding subunit MsrQ [Burkholderiales bacterium]